ATNCKRSTISSWLIALKSNLCALEIIVGGIVCGSVVVIIKIAWAGGSSKVFNNALKAPVVNILTPSIMYTLYSVSLGAYLTLSLIFLISFTPLLLAAFISI